MWTIVWSFINSKAGVAAVAVVIFAGSYGWHKVVVVSLNHTIINQETEIQLAENKIIQQQRLRQTCELNLFDAKHAIERQNAVVSQIRAAADQRVALAQAAALASLTPADEINRIISGPPGHTEMNKFMAEVFGGVSQ